MDASCERRAGCSQASEMPLQLPRDKVTSGCKLRALGSDFSWESQQVGKRVNHRKQYICIILYILLIHIFIHVKYAVYYIHM